MIEIDQELKNKINIYDCRSNCKGFALYFWKIVF